MTINISVVSTSCKKAFTLKIIAMVITASERFSLPNIV